MPFLIPAVAAFICDCFILYAANGPNASVAELPSEDAKRFAFQSAYMIPLCLFRLFLLIFPLPYRSYTGTAVRCPVVYQAFYGGTIVVVLFQMLLLCMLDPSSLDALIPSIKKHGPATEREEATNRIWLDLTLSLCSSLFHVILFLHVRSTAPINAELFSGRPKVLLYYVKEHEDTERDSLLQQDNPTQSRQNSEQAIQSMQRMTNEFVFEMQTRLHKAKTEWTKRLDDYRITTSNGSERSNNSGQDNNILLHRPLTPFRVLLQLFAYEDVLKNGRLDAVYEQDDGAALMFYVPQLLSFLLHGAYESSRRLEDWILHTCRKNIFFAHRCYWFLRAWCLETNETVDTFPHRLSRSSSLASLNELEDSSTLLKVDSKSNLSVGKLLPEERAVIEDLLLRVMESGAEPAKYLQFGDGRESLEPVIYGNNGITQRRLSPSALHFAAENGSIPVDPRTGMPSAKHWDSVAAQHKYGFLPLDRGIATTSTTANHLNHHQEESYFHSTPRFLDSLLAIADALFQVPRKQRKSEFIRQLQALEFQALPSNAIYIPIKDVYHRVWRIVAEESIAMSTKERVPCIVCLEVVRYAREEAASSSSSSREFRRIFDRASRATEESSWTTHPTIGERELLDQWVHGYRDPHRRNHPLEKLAYTMRDGIRKIPIEQMRTSMKAQIDKLRDTRTNLQEMWALSVPESFDDEDLGAPEIHTMESMTSADIERGDTEGDSYTASENNGFHPSTPISTKATMVVASPPASPMLNRSPGPTTAPMGQWASPHKVNTVRDIPIDDVEMLPTYYNSPMKPKRHQAFLNGYGSNALSRPMTQTPKLRHTKLPQNNEESTTTSKNQYNENGKELSTPSKPPPPPPKSAPKTPPVVFKENWKQKEERLRPSSAYGSHPGWGLLPILIKANDDLRQEQLASQLIYRIAVILARESVPVWLCPYEILALTDCGGIIEAIPDTISIASLKKNDPNYTNLKNFFTSYFDNEDELANAKANFCESLAAYSIVCFLLQIKDRHNGNILLDNAGHLIHIDFGFFFLSSPGKNTGFESAPFKLTRDFVEVLDGPESRLFRTFRALCYRAFIALRRHCMEIILLVEMLKNGNEGLACFRGRPDDAIRELRERFRLDLNDRACLEYVNALIDESLENWRTNWYDRYQRYCVGVL